MAIAQSPAAASVKLVDENELRNAVASLTALAGVATLSPGFSPNNDPDPEITVLVNGKKEMFNLEETVLRGPRVRCVVLTRYTFKPDRVRVIIVDVDERGIFRPRPLVISAEGDQLPEIITIG